MVLNKKQVSRLSAASIALGLLASPGAATAQKSAPLSFQASPEVYKVIADGAHYRIIQATWQPGQRDAWHSHPEKGTYFVTSCSIRIYTPDGSHRDFDNVPAGAASVRPPVASHEAQNIGSKVCKMLLFEPK
jgi:quercetin dioxygenase-like cupin family protein